MASEIELKFRVADPDRLRARLLEIGCSLLTDRTFESNTLYDTADRQLRARTELLRIRQYGAKWTLTHKRPPEGNDEHARYKTRIETETELADGDALAEVFTHLGYGPVFRYEKYRAEYECSEGHVVLDETPIGVFAELEGPPSWIDHMIVQLGVREDETSTLSYGALFNEWKERTRSPAENLTFTEVRDHELAAR